MLFANRFSTQLRRDGRRFTLQNILSIPMGTSGVYVLYYDSSFVYVGKARSVRDRLTQHYNGSHSRKLAIWITALDGSISFTYLSSGEEDLDDLERSLIAYLQPVANVERFVGYEPLQTQWRNHSG